MLKKIKNYLLMKNNEMNKLIFSLGFVLIGLGVAIILGIFYPLIKEELKYSLSFSKSKQAVVTQSESSQIQNNNSEIKVITPVDEEFGIVIPKIMANAKVIQSVNPKNPDIYQRALAKGVAHAEGTSLPNESGNIFIFAHSGADLLEANRYNAVFYLLYKLEKGDEIYLFYKGNKYLYKVEEKKTVGATEVSYLTDKTLEKKLTLMTCWPAGTTLKRMIVVAKLVN
ncbi:MAG: sortase [Candidatus Moranbacteria bacterium]|nr:sortase [Candidatus Moranbacteria bacterium]